MKDDKPRCRVCGKYSGYDCDSGTPYGCADPGNPEPLDQEFWCKKCAKIEYKEALREGEKMYLFWEMPDWQRKALEKLGLTKTQDHKIAKITPPHKEDYK